MLKKGHFRGKVISNFPLETERRVPQFSPQPKIEIGGNFHYFFFAVTEKWAAISGAQFTPLFWAGLSLWGGGVEVVQRKLGPISRGRGIFEAVLLLFLEFPGKFVNFGSFSSCYFQTAFTSGFTKDREAQTKLWRKSLELLGLQDI